MQVNFDQKRKGGLKLYVSKVLISDEFRMMPKYSIFVKGIIPLECVDLNVPYII